MLAAGAAQLEGPADLLAGPEREEGVVVPALERDPRRQRLEQLHQGQRPGRAERDGDGHALVLEQARGRQLAADPPGGRRPGAAAGHEGHDQGHRDHRELDAPREHGQEERPADHGQEGDVQRRRPPGHAGSPAGAGHLPEHALDHVARGRARDPQLRPEDEPVGQRGHRHRLHVVGQHEVAPADRRLRPGELEQGQAAPRRGPQRHARVGPRGLGEGHDVALERLAHEDVLQRFLHGQELERGSRWSGRWRRRCGARGAASGSPARRPRSGYPMPTRSRNRSSWASGSG